MNRCQFIEKLVMPQTRLGPIMEWLHQEVWSTERYKKLGFELFLTEGERLVHDAEELVLAAAPAFYDELAQEAEKPRNLISYTLTINSKTGFDYSGWRIHTGIAHVGVNG